MKIISWNCRGLARPQAERAVRALIRRHNPNCVFLMETKVSAEVMESFWRRLGFAQGVAVDAVGLAGGICLFWRTELRMVISKVTGSCISGSITEVSNDKVWSFFAIYGPPYVDKKEEFWKQSDHIYHKMKKGESFLFI